MATDERRRFQRLRLRLPISELSGLGGEQAAGLRTSNISAGGMYFQLPAGSEVEEQTTASFELTVPPGEGYAAAEGRIRGSGRVVRTEALPEGRLGVAVEFTHPLALNLRQ